MAAVRRTRRTPSRPYITGAVQDLVKAISTFEKSLDEREHKELLKMAEFAEAYQDKMTLYKMVEKLNCRRYQTGSGFKTLHTYTHEHGATIEIKEDRF